ncbi:MAG: hypothetical protein EOP47_15435, partial [Sphingobacteriaceae bacterium]
DTAGLKPNDIKKILKARDHVYFGSRMHFIRSLWANELEKNDFYMTESGTSPGGSITIRGSIFGVGNKFEKTYTNDKELYNALIKTRGGEKFFSPQKVLTVKYNWDITNLILEAPAQEVLITANGYNGNELVWGGVMSQQRVSVLLPYEFEPTESASSPQQIDTSPKTIKDPLLVSMITQQDSFLKSHNPEKVYVQTDKPYYITSDTIRLKAYLLNADYLTLSNRSGIMYVELDDQEGKPAKRMMLPVESGLAWGDIALDEKDVPNGSYTLRAYTNWMRNFGEDYIFKKDIYVSPATGNATLVKANFKQEGNKVETTLQFTSLDGKPLLAKDMELKVMDGRKNLSKDQLNTGMDGTLSANFELPPTNNPITIQAKDVTKGITDATTLTIPVTINRIENTDVQFMPEGGNLVAGIKTKVGFKAIAEDGKGTAISGKILNSKQQEVATFKTTYAGMGSFEFTPKADEAYTAAINGINKTYQLPVVNAGGIALRIEQGIDGDSLTITATSKQAVSNNTIYYLIGQARGVVCFAQVVALDRNQTQVLKAAKSAFPTGIARFTLINTNRQPISERQVFINNKDNLNVTIATEKQTYGIRDSIALAIQVKDNNNKPVQGIFSLAVTDDSQVKTDSLSSNILNNLLLTSDLKGNIENPGYYFENIDTKYTQLDNLLLTQGWVGFDWREIFKPITPLPYQPEKEFIVSGTVTNAFGKPIENSQVLLFNNKPFTIKDTLTNKDGKFIFKGLFPVDTAIYKLQARNKNGKEFNVGLKVDEVKPPDFMPISGITPWYVNSDTIRLKNTSTRSEQQKAIANYKGEGNILKEVTIKEKKIVKDSKNLNGPGEADLTIDEEELKKANKMTLEKLLFEKIKGFHIGSFTPPKREYPESLGVGAIVYRDFPALFRNEDSAFAFWNTNLRTKKHKPWRNGYKLITQEVHFIIDGIDLDYFYDDTDEVITINGMQTNDTKRYRYIKNYLDYFTAEDITGIEIMTSAKYAAKYNTEFEQNRERIAPGRSNEFAYIEITTRSKKGPFMQIIPGTYLYKTLAYTLPTQFYSPKYTVANKAVAMGTDMRSTLHWEPNVITNADGKATVSFFTADKASSYTVIMEGITPEGEIGFGREKIKNGDKAP